MIFKRKKKGEVFIRLNEVGHSSFVTLPRRNFRQFGKRMRKLF